MKEKRGLNLKRIYRGCLAGFFLAMVLSTLISRIYDSITVPKVVCQRMKEKAVENVIEGTGVVRETNRFFCTVVPGLRVASVTVKPGSHVKEGEVLFSYDLAFLEKKKEALDRELEGLRLELEREKISGEVYPQVTELNLAERELKMALERLEKGQQEYDQKEREYGEELERLKSEYEKKQAMTREELWLSKDQEEEAVRQELSSAKSSRNAALREAARRVEDLEERLAEMREGDYDEGEIARTARELERAREDQLALEEDWEDRIDDVESRMDLIDDRNERILSGRTSSQAALQEDYEASVRRQEAEWKEEKKKLEELKTAAESASWNVEIAARRDDYTRMENEQRQRLSLLARQKLEMNIRDKEREAEELAGLIAARGQVAAEREGTVVDQEIAAGKTSIGEERLSVAAGGFAFEGEFEKEDQKVAVGDRLLVHIPGGNQTEEMAIEEISLLGEKGVFRGEIQERNLPLGTVTGYECRKQSQIYRQVIPIQALRKDTKGYFCLVARPGRTILGEEFRAERIDVRVLYEGSAEVAVEGGLQAGDAIIVRSSQVIGAGDRVRVAESEK